MNRRANEVRMRTQWEDGSVPCGVDKPPEFFHRHVCEDCWDRHTAPGHALCSECERDYRDNRSDEK